MATNNADFGPVSYRGRPCSAFPAAEANQEFEPPGRLRFGTRGLLPGQKQGSLFLGALLLGDVANQPPQARRPVLGVPHDADSYGGRELISLVPAQHHLPILQAIHATAL